MSINIKYDVWYLVEIDHTFLGMLENLSGCWKGIGKSHRDELGSDFKETVVNTEADSLEQRTPSLEENIADFIRNWLREM